MMTNEELYALCDALRYRVREVPLKSAPAAALPGGCIAVNSERIPNPAAEKEILAHELGHLETGSFPKRRGGCAAAASGAAARFAE